LKIDTIASAYSMDIIKAEVAVCGAGGRRDALDRLGPKPSGARAGRDPPTAGACVPWGRHLSTSTLLVMVPKSPSR